jgi:single-strand DNA-binding protein
MITTTLVGALGRDAIVNDVQGKKVINFSVAITQGYGDNKTTLWVDVAKWGDKTTVAEYLKKGVKVAVSGEPSLRVWEKDGKHGASITLRANEVELLSKAENSAQPQTAAPSNEEDFGLPF